MARGKSIPDVIISIDLGGSLTKVSAINKEGKYCLLALLSEVAIIPPDILLDVQKNHWGEASPEARIWIATSEGEGYALGSYAREQFLAHSNLKLSKLDLAIPKILGVLWVIQQKLGLNSGYSATIGCLLPPAECAKADQQDLIERLTPQLKQGFITPTGKLTVKLATIPVVKPEGAGVFKAYQYKSTEHYLNTSRIGFLGIGFRNSNLLVANKGAIGMSDRHTSALGFYSFVSSASQEIGSAVDEIQLASIIGQAGLDINKLYLERFLKSINKINRLNSVIEAIERAQKMYWHQLQSWLTRVEVDSLDAILLYGGTVEYFRSKLQQRFANLDEIVWHCHLTIPQNLIDSILIERDQSALNLRFRDCWCFLHYLCEPQRGYEEYSLSKLAKQEDSVLIGGGHG